MSAVFIFDAYGTLFDVHAAIARHKEKVGPDADRSRRSGGRSSSNTAGP